ncbi:MAG: hypothetical protein FJ150_06175 [Euryarchaeota archaeon]|nr:hypothetical protein [Euryarchaeota archaeon]
MVYKIGISEIDLEAPPGTSILLSGDLFSGKDVFSRQFVVEGLNTGEACIIISTNEAVEKILDDLGNAELQNLSIIDCISSRFGATVELPFSDQIRYVESPVDLSMMMVATNEFLELYSRHKNIKNVRIVLDSLSTLLMYSDLRTIFRFLHVLTTRVKAVGGVCLIVMEEGAHDEIEEKALQQLTQAIIKMIEGKIQIKGFKNTQFDYEIQDGQIVVGGLDNTKKSL